MYGVATPSWITAVIHERLTGSLLLRPLKHRQSWTKVTPEARRGPGAFIRKGFE